MWYKDTYEMDVQFYGNGNDSMYGTFRPQYKDRKDERVFYSNRKCRGWVAQISRVE